MDKKIGLTVAWLLISLSGCATKLPEVDDGYRAAVAYWNSTRSRPGYDTYHHAFVSSQNAQHLDSAGGCYRKGIDVAYLVLYVDASGVIDKTFARDASPKSACFKSTYLGARMPPPPFSPFPLYMMMKN